MILLFALFACGGEPPPPPGPHAAATKAAVDTLCKLYEGARKACERGQGEATAEGQTLQVSVSFDEQDERLGMFNFKGHVDLSVSGHTYTTYLSGYGGAEAEAIERGLHEWAVVSGVAIVDAVLNDPARPALKAVEPRLAEEALTAGGRQVIRGWTLLRPAYEGGIDHQSLLNHISSDVEAMGAGPHLIQIQVTTELAKQTFTCWLDGRPAASLCAKVEGWSWPETGNWEAKQVYILR